MRLPPVWIVVFALLFLAACHASDGGSDDDSTDDDLADDDAADDDFDDDQTDDDAVDDDTVSDDDSAPDDDTAVDDDTFVDDDTAIDDDTLVDDDSAIDDDTDPLTTVSGGAYNFGPAFGMVAGAQVTVLERPDLPAVTTDENGLFTIEGVHVGDDLTLVLSHPDYYPTLNSTAVPGPAGISDLSLQVPPTAIVYLLAIWMLTPLDPNACQIAATVSPPGGTPFSPGVVGASVEIDPPVDPSQGPFYFYYFQIPGWPAIDLPVRWLDATTDDGGVIFMNVTPGEYTLTAHLDGVKFETARVKCVAGYLVNASPPHGLQQVAGPVPQR